MVDKIAAEQQQIGHRRCDDLFQLVAEMLGCALPEVQIAHVEYAKRMVYLREADHLAADVGRFARSDFNLPGKSHASDIPRVQRRELDRQGLQVRPCRLLPASHLP